MEALKTRKPFLLTRVIDRITAGYLFILLGLILFVSPLAYGSVQFWSQGLVYLLASGMSLGLVVFVLFNARGRIVWTWAYVPIVLFLALVLLQCLRLPAGWIAWLSPGTTETTNRLTEGLTHTDSTQAYSALSLYPAETMHHLYLQLIFVVVFLTVLQLSRSPRGVRAMLWMMAGSGTVVAMIAATQNILPGTGMYPGIDAMPFNSGPFAAHSHFGQFMNLSIGSVLALWAVYSHGTNRNAYNDQTDKAPWIGAGVTFGHGLFAGAVILMAVIVALAATRGGLVAGSVAVTVAACLFAARRWGLQRSVPAVVSAVLLVTNFCGAVTLSKQETRGTPGAEARNTGWRLAEGGRLEIVRDSVPAFKTFAMMGTGLGTFEYVFPMYDESNRPTRAAHADNDYLQLLFEMGLIGALLVLLFMGIVFRDALKALWSVSQAPEVMGLYGLLYGVVAVAVHSSVDFGQRIPGVAVMTAVTLGLIVGISRQANKTRKTAERPKSDGMFYIDPAPLAWRIPMGVLCLLLVSVTSYAGLAFFENHRRAELAWHIAQRKLYAFEADRSAGVGADRRRVIRAMAKAVEHAPGDVRYLTGYNEQRWLASLESRINSETDTPADTRWAKEAEQIAVETETAIRLCPTYGPAHSLAGHVRWEGLQDNKGVRFIVQGAQLAGHDASACIAAGRALGQAARWDEAEPWFARAIRRKLRCGSHVADVLVQEFDKPALALRVIEDDPVALMRLIRAAHRDPRHTADAMAWLQTYRDTIIAAADNDYASPSTLAARAQMHRIEGDLESAATWYRRALALNDNRPAWHYDLAMIHYELGEYEMAQQHNELSLALSPGLERAEALRASLSNL